MSASSVVYSCQRCTFTRLNPVERKEINTEKSTKSSLKRPIIHPPIVSLITDNGKINVINQHLLEWHYIIIAIYI